MPIETPHCAMIDLRIAVSSVLPFLVAASLASSLHADIVIEGTVKLPPAKAPAAAAARYQQTAGTVRGPVAAGCGRLSGRNVPRAKFEFLSHAGNGSEGLSVHAGNAGGSKRLQNRVSQSGR